MLIDCSCNPLNIYYFFLSNAPSYQNLYVKYRLLVVVVGYTSGKVNLNTYALYFWVLIAARCQLDLARCQLDLALCRNLSPDPVPDPRGLLQWSLQSQPSGAWKTSITTLHLRRGLLQCNHAINLHSKYRLVEISADWPGLAFVGNA